MAGNRYIGIFNQKKLIRTFRTLKEAGEYVGCSISTVSVYARKGKPFGKYSFCYLQKSKEKPRKTTTRNTCTPVTMYDLEGNVVRTLSSFKNLEKFYNNRCMERYVNKERIFREKYIIRNEKFDPTKVTPFVFQKNGQQPVVEVRCDGFEIMTSALKNTIMDCTRKVFVRLGDLCRIPA